MKSVFLLFSLLLCNIVVYSQNSSSNISLIANWNPDSITQYNDIWGYMDCNGNEYAIIGSKYKIHFLDLEDNSNPVEVASFEGGQGTTWRDIKTFRNRAYAVSDNTSEGLLIFDLSNLPLSVTKTYHSNAMFNKAHNIFIDEVYGRLYVVGSNVGHLLIYDLMANPDNPELLVNTSLPGGYIHDLYVRDNKAYCNHLSNGMYIYDCTNPQNIQTLGSVTDYLGTVFNHSSWLTADGNNLVFCDEKHGESVKIANVSDPTDITVSANHMFNSALQAPDFTNSIAHNPLIRDGYAFVSYYHDGVQVFDISNPDSIQRVAYFDTYPENTNYNGYEGCWGVYPFLSSGIIIASDLDHGLYVLSMDAIDLAPTIDELLPNATLAVDAGPIICQGDSIVLTTEMVDGMNYTWTKDNETLSNDTNSLIIKEPGTYQLTVSNGYCTSTSEEKSFEFTEAPDLSTMLGDQTEICEDTNYTITAPTGLDNYVWMKDGNALANTNNIVQVVESGTYTLLAYQDGCPSFSLPYEIIITEIPTPYLISNNPNPCSNEIVLLEAPTGAEQYHWYRDGDLIITTDESSINIEEGGIYTVELMSSICSKISEPINIAYLPLPTNDISLTGSGFLCPGESIYISADDSDDVASWNWTLGGNIISTDSEIEVSETGLYELEITSTNGCTDYNQQYIEVMTIVTPEITIQGNMLVCSETALAYQWFISDLPIEGANSQSYTPAEVGFYSVQITDAAGCSVVSEQVEVTVVGTNSPESLKNVLIYPNPAKDQVYMEFSSNKESDVTIELFNINGQILLSQIIKNITKDTETIDVAHLPKGVYLLQLTNQEGSLTRKVVKE